jgi:ribosomal-protein-alanine N-acetyltransferase
MGRGSDPLVRSAAAAALRLSPMRPDELDAVMEIERRCFTHPWTPGLFLHELKIPFSTTLIARLPDSDEIVGYVCWWVVGDEVHLLNVAVAPEHRRYGIGRALLQLLLDEASSRHSRVVTLEVEHANRAAIALYEKLGFGQIGLRKNYYGSGEHAVIMALTL